MARKTKKKDDFVENATTLLSDIAQAKRKLMALKNEELRKLSQGEKEQLKLIRERTKQQQKEIIERYEKAKEDLGMSLLMHKKKKLRGYLSGERKSLSKMNKTMKRKRIVLKE